MPVAVPVVLPCQVALYEAIARKPLQDVRRVSRCTGLGPPLEIRFWSLALWRVRQQLMGLASLALTHRKTQK
jgi:hypothetical protein